MGGGNAEKSARARADAAKKKAAEGSGGGGAGGAAKRAAPTFACSICRQSFPTTQPKMMQMHVDSRHSKSAFSECFPECTPPS
eukprot:NODE_27956_length_494_cov_3.193460.p4 GENE.NODE_27956_length_494_cov_3.193460~~NODE_27956_length_494_cov_3.193460.p4  ORF type:complete len:83 (-),score=26.78 NODE_27956_length_494_cov_3.193460:159-407(-)